MYKDTSQKSGSEINHNEGLPDKKKKIAFPLGFVLVCIAVSLLSVSCVSSKKLAISDARVSDLQKDSTNTHNQLNTCTMQLKNLNSAQKTLQNKNTMVQNNLDSVMTSSNMTIADQAKRLKDFQDIVQTQKQVLDRVGGGAT